MAKADIDFDKELWDTANYLRGAVSENNYKNYILPLVFVKHLSKRYEVAREELKEQLNDPESDYYTTDKEEINYVLEDRDEYRSRNTETLCSFAQRIVLRTIKLTSSHCFYIGR